MPAATAIAAPTAAEKETAHALMVKGEERSAKGDYAGAEEAFKAAHELMNVPTTALALAKARIAQGKLVEARAVLRPMAQTEPEPGEPDVFTQAREQIQALSLDVAKRVPSLRVEVLGADKSEVEVRVDDVVVPTEAVGASWSVNPGKHVVVASGPGFERTQVRVTVAENETRTVRMAMTKLAPGASEAPAPKANAGTGSLRVNSGDPGEAFLDGQSIGRVPGVLEGLPPGVHRLRIDIDVGGSYERKVFVEAGETASVTVERDAMDMAGGARDGVSLGLTFGGVLPSITLDDDGGPRLGPVVGLFGNIGVSPWADLRIGLYPQLEFPTTSDPVGTRTLAQEDVASGGTLFTTRIPFDVRVNLGSVYSMVFGIQVELGVGIDIPVSFEAENPDFGFAEDYAQNATAFLLNVGPEWSFLSFRFGDKRQFELEMLQSLSFNVVAAADINQESQSARRSVTRYGHRLGFSYLFL